MAKKPYKTPKTPAVDRLKEDRQWSELSTIVQKGLVGSARRVAMLWLQRQRQK